MQRLNLSITWLCLHVLCHRETNFEEVAQPVLSIPELTLCKSDCNKPSSCLQMSVAKSVSAQCLCPGKQILHQLIWKLSNHNQSSQIVQPQSRMALICCQLILSHSSLKRFNLHCVPTIRHLCKHIQDVSNQIENGNEPCRTCFSKTWRQARLPPRLSFHHLLRPW